MNNKPIKIQELEIDNKVFSLICDVNIMQDGISRLRNEFDNAVYGYKHYRKNSDTILSPQDYQNNIDKFEEEIKKRLDENHVRKVFKRAKKKANGSFYKNRTYNEYTLRNARDTGSGTFNVYKVRYEVADDLTMLLTFHYTTEWWL